MQQPRRNRVEEQWRHAQQLGDTRMSCWPPRSPPGPTLHVVRRHDILSLWWRILQNAWLLLVCCAAARANFFLRSVSPGHISTVASRHDDQLWSCHCALFGSHPRECHALPWISAVWTPSGAARSRHAAHWASWAVQEAHLRHSTVARTIIEAVEINDPSQTAQGVVSSVELLRAVLWFGGRGRFPAAIWTPEGCRSCRATKSVPFTSLPTCPPLNPSGCSFSVLCAFFFPSLHAGAGVASTRLPWPPPISVLESGNPGSQRISDGVCGGAHSLQAWRRGLDQHHGARPRLRRVQPLGWLAIGLHLWRGAQHAIVTTLVSPVRADGTARQHAGQNEGGSCPTSQGKGCCGVDAETSLHVEAPGRQFFSTVPPRPGALMERFLLRVMCWVLTGMGEFFFALTH